MATLINATIPACELALSEAFTSLPNLEIEAEQLIKGGENTVMPLLWVRGVEPDDFEAACESDPTVDELELLTAFDDELLYRMQWFDQVSLLFQMLTNAKACLLDAFGKNGTWSLRLMYPSREHLSETKMFCSEHELSFSIEAIQELEGEPSGRYGLTTKQYRALVTAVNAGFFDVPREVTLREVATEMEISHQALSECLRRGTHALVENTVLIGPAESHP
ncbi:helix-turn-helix domain-containing protein [Haloarcula nitratireducens]|uniref:Helix-turn-helix domain-containing protein n=1 Tax=Haloarcula nitratireducens TaxID=2487749 RepID=A0AAW4PEK2_9EURY|nr:helix-turn-helix domain-containing protein [Halomicroarcula nitratireducens]MBX0296766.1 helix-turn-helix domain-containing protein [Halomicroarcula nitratireducens]